MNGKHQTPVQRKDGSRLLFLNALSALLHPVMHLAYLEAGFRKLAGSIKWE